MKAKKIVITGGPSTGKTSVINQLIAKKETCFEEVSRKVTLEARAQGITQLFLTDPLLFSQKLLDSRIEQFHEAETSEKNQVFLDRGIPDVVAYMDFVNDTYPEHFVDACKNHVYNMVFILPPWEQIYTQDNERYENFNEAIQIDFHLKNTYQKYGYNLIEVPFGSVEERVDFILNQIEN